MTEESCEYLLNYVLLQPYWLLVVSKLVFSILSFLWNGVKKLIYMSCCCCCCCCEDEEKAGGEADKEETLLQKVYTKYSEIDLYFLVIQVLFQLLHFGYIVVTTYNYSPTPPTPSPSSWQRYQMMYASYFNSGVATVGHAVLRKTEQEVEKESTKWALIVVVPLFLSVLPFLCTHSIPMIFAYIWVSLPLFLIGLAAATIMRKLSKRKITWFSLIVLIVVEIVYFATFVGLFVAPVNYGVLLYEHKYAYVDVVVREYELRSTVCYFDDLTHQIKARNILNLLSFLV